MKKIADFFRKKSVIITLSIVLGVVLVSAGFLGYIYPADNIAKGISVNGINIGGMSMSEAEAAVKTEDRLDEQRIVIADASGAKKEFSGLDIMLSYDFEKTIESAYEIGRSDDILNDIITLSALVFKPHDTGYKYSYDKEKLEQIIYDFGVSVNGEMIDYTLDFRDGYVEVSKGVAGQKKDVSLLLSDVCDAIENAKFEIGVVMEKENPPEPDAKGLCDYIYSPPENATYTVTDGIVNITDAVYGRSVSIEDVVKEIDKLINGETITLKLEAIKPEITRGDLIGELFNYTLGSYTTKYSVSNKPRTNNVVLAANLINGVTLAPGETFSYNKVVGPRTSSRGFKEATVYSNGEKVMGIGGGICQVSSTLYSAVLHSDLEVTERRNHSMTVDYMPKGQDATVSYGSIDFKFRNNTKNPVKIVASASGGVLTVSILGTKTDTEKTVKITNSVVEVIDKTVEDVVDETLKAGETKTISVGKTGYVVDTYKKVYENGVEVRSERVGRSRYRMVPQKRAVGPSPTETPVPSVEDTPKETTSPEEKVEDAPVFNEEELETEETTETFAPQIEESIKPQIENTPNPETDKIVRPEANAEIDENSVEYSAEKEDNE